MHCTPLNCKYLFIRLLFFWPIFKNFSKVYRLNPQTYNKKIRVYFCVIEWKKWLEMMAKVTGIWWIFDKMFAIFFFDFVANLQISVQIKSIISRCDNAKQSEAQRKMLRIFSKGAWLYWRHIFKALKIIISLSGRRRKRKRYWAQTRNTLYVKQFASFL